MALGSLSAQQYIFGATPKVLNSMGVRIQYDEGKNLKNIRKHGLSFETASIAFDDPSAVVIYDDSHSDSEDRYNLLGAVGSHILFIVYTVRDKTIRMISARPATRQEKERYYQKL